MKIKRVQRGMSLVEILVGMAIGLIGIVLINEAQIVFEGYKRSTTGAGEAQVNGALALYSVERDLRMAGAGIAASAAFNCTYVQWQHNGTFSIPPAASTLPTIYMAPVRIIETAGAPDQIFLLSGSATNRMVPAQVQQAVGAFGAQLTLDNGYGFATGDMLIVENASTCTLTQVNNTPDPAATGKLGHDNSTGSVYNIDPAANSFGGVGTGSLVMNIGAAPIIRTYSIVSNSLQVADALTIATGGAALTVVNDIVDLQAEYGKDDGSNGGTADDGAVDGYDSIAPTTSAGWKRVLAIRMGVLARSQNYEKPDPTTGACSATAAAPTWAGGAFTMPDGVPSCYKYRVFETVVPMRNMIWRAI
jgi:type IV pilus assembly protein PilW